MKTIQNLSAKVTKNIQLTKFYVLYFVNLEKINKFACRKEILMKSSPYKIVICTPALYSAGGVERMMSVKANYFADMLNYDVNIIVTEGKGCDSFFYLSDKVNIINFELNFEELWHVSFLKKLFLFLRKQTIYKKLLKKELIKINPDFTISTLRREINFISDIKDGSIKIGELHVNRSNYRNYDERKFNVVKKVFTLLWMKSLVRHLKQLDKMVVLTDCALNDWPELNNVVKIPDPLPFKMGEISNLSQKRIISVGRYAYDKGNDLLLQVWKIVEGKIPGWYLDVFGNGIREPYISQMQYLGIDSSRCHLYGPTLDVKNEYLKSSVFVLPSRFEGFGLVLIEAMACGLPVIAFDCENGPRSIITDGVDGFLIPPFDIEAYVDKVLLLIQNEALRKLMGENARKTAAQYDIEIIGQQWKKMFDELMQNK